MSTSEDSDIKELTKSIIKSIAAINKALEYFAIAIASVLLLIGALFLTYYVWHWASTHVPQLLITTGVIILFITNAIMKWDGK